MSPEKPSIYPTPSKGPLANDQSKYQQKIKRNGIKDGDIWPLIVVSGIVLVGLAAAYLFFYAGFGEYLNK